MELDIPSPTSTLSVNSPQTPESGWSIPIVFAMAEDELRSPRDPGDRQAEATEIVSGVYRGRNENVEAENETLTAENETLTAENETLTAENETLTAENETLTAENETFTADNASQARALENHRAQDETRRQNTKWYQWKFTANLIAKESVDNIIKHINTECKTKRDISKYLWNESPNQARKILNNFPKFLENYEDADNMRKNVAEIILNIKPFTIYIPKIKNYSTVQGSQNKFLRDHEINFGEYRDPPSEPDYSTVKSLLENIKDIGPVLDLFSHDFKIRDKITESKATNISEFRFDLLLQILGQMLGEEGTFYVERGLTLGSLGIELIPGYRLVKPDLILVFGIRNGVMTCEVKGLPMWIETLDDLRRFPGLWEGLLRQASSQMIIALRKHAILSFGVVNILITILVEEFLANPHDYEDGHIVPLELQLVRIDRDPIIIEVDFFLKARRSQSCPDLKTMAERLEGKAKLSESPESSAPPRRSESESSDWQPSGPSGSSEPGSSESGSSESHESSGPSESELSEPSEPPIKKPRTERVDYSRFF